MLIKIIIFFFILCNSLISQPLKDTVEKAKDSNVYYKSSQKAMFLSTLLPGGGQFYTENYLKGIFIAGVEGTLTFYALKNHIDYKRTGNFDLRNRATNLLWWLALVKIFSVADAYVSANMFKFKEQQKLISYHRIYETNLLGLADTNYKSGEDNPKNVSENNK